MQKRKRIVCILMAVCMVVSSLLVDLTSSGTVISVQAAESGGEEGVTESVPFELDFNDNIVGQVPEGWTEDEASASVSAEAGYSSMKVVEDGDNKIVKFEQTTARTSQYYMHYNFTGTDKAVLEYRFKTDSNTKNIWLPALTYDGNASTQPLFLLFQGGTLKYSAQRATWVNAVTNMADGWHTLKLIVDLKENVRELYVDGNQITLDATELEKKDCQSDKLLSSVAGGFYSAATSSTYCIDDVKVSNYVEATGASFTDTKYTVVKGETITLHPTITPSDANVYNISYTSDDNTIATVAANGVITGAELGKTTITATTTSGTKTLGTTAVEVTVIDNVSIPFELNFNDQTKDEIPVGWVEDAASANDSTAAEYSSMKVVEDGDNKIVKFEQTTARTSQYYMHYNFTGTDKAVLEYRFKTDSSTNSWLPAFTYDGNASTQPLFLLFQGRTLKYSVDCAKWGNAVIGMADGWHTLKLIVDLKENVRELYVDGNQIVLDATYVNNTCQSDKLLSSVAGGFYSKATSSTYYIDDLKVSKVQELPKIPFELNFDGQTVNEIPEGWTEDAASASAEAGYSSMKVVEDGDNKIVKFEQTTARTSQYYMHYNFTGTDKAVLEYRFKTDSSTKNIWLPAFTYGGDASTQPLFLYFDEQKRVRYSVNRNTWVDAVTNMADGWHTLKLIVDLEENVRELYVDGARITLDATQLANIACKSNELLSSVAGGFFSLAENSAYYVDNVKVSKYIEGESVGFEQTEYTIPKGGNMTLIPVFTPENTSNQVMTYSSSDTGIVTVDTNGVVTGMAEGEATITATPSLSNLQPVTVKIKVEGKVNGTITISPSEISLPVDGHTFLEPSLQLDHTADKNVLFTSANPDIASVDEWGEVLAIDVGKTQITISAAANSEISTTVDVTVTEACWQTIYVSPDGNGDKSGRDKDNTTTLAGALAKIADIDKTQMDSNIEVILAEGYYYQSETIELNENHGGNDLYTVVFKAADDAEVTIGGGMQIQGNKFTECTESGMEGIYVVEVPSGTQTRQLFVDDVRATRARSEGTLKNAEFLYDEDKTMIIGLVCDNTELLDYKNPDGLEFVYSGGYWQQSRVGVKEINKADDGRVQLIMDQPAFGYSLVYHSYLVFQIERIDYYENALGLLDEPGEWYLDETASKLYYMPRSWEEMNEVTVTVPVLDIWGIDSEGQDTGKGGLMTVTGSDYDHMVKNIRFEGITFADVTWMRPSSENGHIAQQNNHIRNGHCIGREDYTADAAVLVQRANSISFVDCDFTRIGSIALKMTGGVQNSMIIGNHFYDISGNAIQVGEPDFTRNVDNYNPTDIRKMMKNCDVLNNYIHNIGVDFHSSAAIGVSFVADMDICHNEIFNIPYSGMHIGYGWNVPFENVLHNMNISDNFIHDYLQELGDGGAIYVNGNTAGNNSISGNYTRNQGARVAALYFDNGSTDWLAWNNVLDTSETLVDKYIKMKIYWTYVNNPANDILIKNNYATADYSMSNKETLTNIVMEDNTTVTNLDWPEEAQQIIANSGLQTAYEGLRNNQAERISTNLSKDEPIALVLNETFQISVTATDGKNNAVTLGNTVYYDIVDKEVATVSDTGLLTVHNAGETLLRVYVVSNDILDVIEAEIIAGYNLSEIALEEISDDITLYMVSGSETHLQAYGLTDKGRKVAVTDVTYEIFDSNIASVSEDGVLEPVAAGETTLTVTGTAGNQTVSTTYKITVSELAGEVSYLDDIFKADNQKYWIGRDLYTYHTTTWENVDGVSITTELSGPRNYSGCKYQNEILTFYLGLEAKMDWPSFYIRTQQEDNAVGLGATGYIVCFTEYGMQLQRFNGTQRTVIYGTVGGVDGIVAPNVYPYALQDEQLHKIQVGAVNEADGVRLIMYIDGKMIFDYLDTADNAIRDAGYFGLIGTASASSGKADKFTLVKAYDTDALEQAVDAAEEITESGYTDESFAVFTAALTATKEILEGDPRNVTQEKIASVTDTLEKAIAGLTKKTVEIVASATDGIYTLESMKTVTITCTGDFDEFISVTVDGKLVDRANYDVYEGTTILVFKPAYLETLAAGTHEVILSYTLDRSAKTTLQVVEKSVEPDSEQKKPDSEEVEPDSEQKTDGEQDNNSKDMVIEGNVTNISGTSGDTSNGTNARNTMTVNGTTTGDTNTVTLWLVLALFAVAVIAVFKRKSKHESGYK